LVIPFLWIRDLDSDPFFASARTKTEFTEIRSAAIECQKDFLAETQHMEQAQR